MAADKQNLQLSCSRKCQLFYFFNERIIFSELHFSKNILLLFPSAYFHRLNKKCSYWYRAHNILKRPVVEHTGAGSWDPFQAAGAEQETKPRGQDAEPRQVLCKELSSCNFDVLAFLESRSAKSAVYKYCLRTASFIVRNKCPSELWKPLVKNIYYQLIGCANFLLLLKSFPLIHYVKLFGNIFVFTCRGYSKTLQLPVSSTWDIKSWGLEGKRLKQAEKTFCTKTQYERCMRMPAEIESPVVLNVIGPGTVPETYMQQSQGMGNGKCYCSCVPIRN